MSTKTLPPTFHQFLSTGQNATQPWLDWFYRFQDAAGTVESIGISAPGEIIVSGSPVVKNGTISLAWSQQAAGTVFAGPTTGANAAPTFRRLVNTDLPKYLWTSNVVSVSDNIVVPVDYSMTVVGYLDVIGTLDILGNVGIF